VSFHHTICFFESHCNNICKFVGIYRGIISYNISMDKLYCRVNFIDKVVGKSYMSSYFYCFFYLFFSRCNSLGLLRDMAMEKFVGKIHCNLQTEKIILVFPFIFVKFLVVNYMQMQQLKEKI
jgi:hypothetical protein